VMEKNNKLPATVDEAVNFLMDELSFGDRTIIANMKEEDIGLLDFAFRNRIKGEFGLGNGNKKLLQSCRFGSGKPSIDLDSALAFIIRRLWNTVHNTRVMKAVK
jgi:hypothetical protein